nr:MAG TPA: hypothetical protein [Caudoviricetes sp.]
MRNGNDYITKQLIQQVKRTKLSTCYQINTPADLLPGCCFSNSTSRQTKL